MTSVASPLRRTREILQVLPTYDPSFGGPVSAALAVSESYEAIEGVRLTTLGGGRPGSGWRGFRTIARTVAAPRRELRHTLSVGPGLWWWFIRHVRAYDLVHVHYNRSLLMVWVPLLATLLRRPYVLQTHGMCAPWRGPLALVDILFTRPALRHARAVYVLTPGEGDEVRHAAPDTPVLVVHNAVRASRAVGRGGRGARAPRLLFCARLHPRKGLDRYLDVVERLAPEFPGLVGHVVGPDEGALAAARERVASAGLPVTFRGGLDRDGVDAAMAGCDVLLHPAPREPFGMSMLEAFAADLPVVAAASSELAGVFAAEGAALLPADDDVEAWVAAVRRVVTDPRTAADLRAGGRAVLERNFSRASLTRTLAGVIHAV